MPIYRYRCEACGKEEEIFFRKTSSAEKEQSCSSCGGRLEKIIAPAAVMFKGSGFYITDYAKGHNGSKPADHKEDTLRVDSSNKESKTESSEPAAAK